MDNMGYGVKMIVGKRIILREIEEEDLDLIVKWRNDPEILKWLFSYLHLSKVKQRKWYEKYLDDATQQTFIIEVKEEKTLIGTIGLTDIDYKNQKGELTIIIGEKEYWGKGLGEESLKLLVKFAFNEMNLRKIKALVFSDNEVAIKLYEKCGFVKEGVLQEEIFKNGAFKDVILMSFRGGRK
jgi:UDP-4-amino-4,6-dideoxy-N-acetyl-beta-L-altrosamine N-acetyltransferase